MHLRTDSSQGARDERQPSERPPAIEAFGNTMHVRAFLRRLRERPVGQSLVEFALLLPVFLLVVSAAVDLGRIAYARVTIANVAREASFQAAQTPTSYQAGQPCDSANTSDNLVICRAILESKGSVVTVAPSDIVMSCTPSCDREMGNTVKVTATGHFNLVTPVMSVFFGSTAITFSSTSTNQISALPDIEAVETDPPPAEPVTVPNLVGHPEGDVPGLLAAAVLISGTRTEAFDASVPAGTVMGQSPAAGSLVDEGAFVDYVVSKGPPPPTPNLGCSVVSAGFTYSTTPANDVVSPVTVSVTDTTTFNSSCNTVWAWSWGDGQTTFGKVQAPHVYTNAGPGAKHYSLSLTVTSGTFTSTTGGYSIMVKP